MSGFVRCQKVIVRTYAHVKDAFMETGFHIRNFVSPQKFIFLPLMNTKYNIAYGQAHSLILSHFFRALDTHGGTRGSFNIPA